MFNCLYTPVCSACSRIFFHLAFLSPSCRNCLSNRFLDAIIVLRFQPSLFRKSDASIGIRNETSG